MENGKEPKNPPPEESCLAWWIWRESDHEYRRKSGLGEFETEEEARESPPIYQPHSETPVLIREIKSYTFLAGSEPSIQWNTKKSMIDASEVCRLMATDLENGLKMGEGSGLVIGQATKADIKRQLSTLERASKILRKRADVLKAAAAEEEESEADPGLPKSDFTKIDR